VGYFEVFVPCVAPRSVSDWRYGGKSSSVTIKHSKTYDPVNLIVGCVLGCVFVFCGLWVAYKFLFSAPTIIMGILIFDVFVFIPVIYGVSIIRNQLRLWKNSK
jgi:hypothetical protein